MLHPQEADDAQPGRPTPKPQSPTEQASPGPVIEQTHPSESLQPSSQSLPTLVVESSSSQCGQPLIDVASNYLDKVKLNYEAQPEIYERFLDMLKDFYCSNGKVEAEVLAVEVRKLFAGDEELIRGFEKFVNV